MAVKLTLAEKRLLKYPPTSESWLCQRVRTRLFNDEVEEITCNAVNAGIREDCWICRKRKGKRTSVLLWPRYLKACEAAGINPGDKWREQSAA